MNSAGISGRDSTLLPCRLAANPRGFRGHDQQGAHDAQIGRQGPAESWGAVARVMRFAAFALAGALAGLAIEIALKNDPLAAARILRYYWFRQVDVALPLAIAIACRRRLRT
jgi:hypothetical protein